MINHYFQGGANVANKNEQNLIERMVAEVIQIKGHDVYYIPRNIVNLDEVFLEDASSTFDRFHVIEMYCENVDGFGGDEMLSKFGLEIRQTATFTVSRKRWEECTRNDSGLQLPNRPCEGDLIYHTPAKSFLEIRKVVHDDPFYQLGKLYVYKLTCELFQYSHEIFNTGDVDVDAINARNTDELQNLVLDEYGYAIKAENGDFILKDDFEMKKVEPTSDNDELVNRANELVDWDVRNPFASLSKG